MSWKCYGSIALVILIAMTTLSSVTAAYMYRAQAKSAIARAEAAESERDAAIHAKDSLEMALSAQEKATVEAQQRQKVVYRTVKQEVEKNEASRDWFNSPVPDGMRRLLSSSSAGG